MLLAVQDLGRGERDVGERPPDRPGDALFQQLQIFLLLLCGKQDQGFVKIGDDLRELVDVTAADPCDRGPVRLESAPQLGGFLVDHKYIPLLE